MRAKLSNLLLQNLLLDRHTISMLLQIRIILTSKYFITGCINDNNILILNVEWSVHKFAMHTSFALRCHLRWSFSLKTIWILMIHYASLMLCVIALTNRNVHCLADMSLGSGHPKQFILYMCTYIPALKYYKWVYGRK